ncbi:MAG: carbohydrate-binding protein, partial [Oscillospiraceae bacterium]|nr:carbohydrate-binding protein [Oscillospiraceae bacterium]
AFVARGYPIINTEVPCRFELTQHPDVGIYNVLEQKGIAWLGFVNENLIGRPARWRGPFDAGGVAWAPDYGDWPAMGAIYPFEKRAAASNVFGTTAAAVTDRGRRVMHMESGDYVTYSRVGFGSREPLSFLLGISSPGGGSIVVREGGPGGRVLGECALPASAEGFDACNAYAGGPLMAAVGGIADITFTYEGSGTAVFRDWQFVLPKQISYTDPQKIIDAANYPYRTGDIVRRPSTDGGSPAELHVEGIMDGSSLLFDFVRFRDSINTSFNIRAMPLAGGSIEIWAGDFETCVWLLGICEIDGPAGAWADFSCALDMEQVQTGWTHAHTSNTRWDLKLVFTGEPGQELFAISEFYMGGGDSGGSGEGGGSGSGGKPARADRHAPKVYTGHANSVTAATAKVSFSKLSGFEDLDVLEAGIMLSLDESFSDYIELIANPSDISSILSYYTIRLDLSGALEAFGSPDLSNAPDLFWNIRAYAKTNDGIYLGGVRRFAPAGG